MDTIDANLDRIRAALARRSGIARKGNYTTRLVTPNPKEGFLNVESLLRDRGATTTAPEISLWKQIRSFLGRRI